MYRSGVNLEVLGIQGNGSRVFGNIEVDDNCMKSD